MIRFYLCYLLWGNLICCGYDCRYMRKLRNSHIKLVLKWLLLMEEHQYTNRFCISWWCWCLLFFIISFLKLIMLAPGIIPWSAILSYSVSWTLILWLELYCLLFSFVKLNNDLFWEVRFESVFPLPVNVYLLKADVLCCFYPSYFLDLKLTPPWSPVILSLLFVSSDLALPSFQFYIFI
jgi:hypothetical protein